MVRTILAGLIALQSLAWSQHAVNPLNRPTLQEAIYSASEGDVLYADLYHPRIKEYIYVDRPLTIVGGTYRGHAIDAFGPGHGRMSLVGARIIDARYSDPSYSGYATSGATFHGFDQLHLVGCYVEATSVRWSDDQGHPAVSTYDIPVVVLKDSVFIASPGVSQFLYAYVCGSVLGPGRPAVWTLDSTTGTLLLAQGCSFYGGAGNQYCFDEASGVCGPSPSYSDPGGPGLITDRLFFADCTFVGGMGSTWEHRPEQGPMGAPFIANTAIPLIDLGVRRTR